MTDTMKHFEQPTSSTHVFCLQVSCILFIHISSSIFQRYDRLKSDTSAAQGEKTKTKQQQQKKNVKKTHLGQVFQSVMSFET